jgi:predicted secreted protein
MSLAVAGVGTKFQRWSGSAYVSLAEVTSITGPTMTRDFIDVTSLDSTGGYREFITGFRDAGTISLNMNFTRY